MGSFRMKFFVQKEYQKDAIEKDWIRECSTLFSLLKSDFLRNFGRRLASCMFLLLSDYIRTKVRTTTF